MHKSLLQFFFILTLSSLLFGSPAAQVKLDSLKIAQDDSVAANKVHVPSDTVGHAKQSRVAAPTDGSEASQDVPHSLEVNKEPPVVPITLRVNGTNPSPWQKTPRFTLAWETSADLNGIKALYKLGMPPSHNADTTGSAKGTPPLNVLINKEDGEEVHVWLQDDAGNSDFRNFASAVLRFDATAPVLDSLVLSTQPLFFNNGVHWFDPTTLSPNLSLLAYFREQHAAMVQLDAEICGSQSIVPNSVADSVRFILQFAEIPQGIFPFYVTCLDSAGNAAKKSIKIGFDSLPPQNTVAQSPDTTKPGEFMVSWDIGDVIENGAGLSGVYDVRIKVDDAPWELGTSQYKGTSFRYKGEDGHRYAFEIAAYDIMGNKENFSGIAESVTAVIAGFVDVTPPKAPIQLTINNSASAAWINHSTFTVRWLAPADPSGIAKIYYKFFEPPAHQDDFVGSEVGRPPLILNFDGDGQTPVYFWLEDGAGNVDYRHYAQAHLRYDGSPPHIDNFLVTNVVENDQWFNPDSIQNLAIRLVYSEDFPDSLRFYFANKLVNEQQVELRAGKEQDFDLGIPLAGLSDGCYPLTVMLSDSAGNVTIDSLLICLDSTPPTGATATAPAQSLSNVITIAWQDENAGSDADGSGLSGEYDLRIRIDDGQWQQLLAKEQTTSFTYTSAPQASLAFEVAAWDQAGNREAFTGIPEATTEVDTFFIDQTAPAAPINLTARGMRPGRWQNQPHFVLEWQNPLETSGIQKAFYKFDTPPAFASDCADSVESEMGIDSLSLSMSVEKKQLVYVWLQDGQGNADYTTAASTLLCYDITAPVLLSMQAADSALRANSFNQLTSPDISLRIVFQENFPDSLSVFSDSLGRKKIKLTAENAIADTVKIDFHIENAPDGSHRLYAVLTDSAGNISNLDSLEIFLDSRPPSISHTPPDSIVTAGTPVTIQATVGEAHELHYVELLYWQGGERRKQSVPMTWISDSTYKAEIPATAVASRGVEYLIVAGDGVNENRFPLSRQNNTAFSLRVHLHDGIAMPSPVQAGSDENAYRLVSFPLDMQRPTGAELFESKLGTFNPNFWRLLRWNPADLQFIEYPEISEIQHGVGYWLWTANRDVQLETNAGLTVNTAKPYTLVLKKGWNDIGIPFDFPIDWKDIVAVSAFDTQKVQGPYSYLGRWRYPFENKTLHPWIGYSIYADVDDIRIVIPALQAQSPLAKAQSFASHNDFLWAFEIKAQSNDMIDAANFFGCVKSAGDNWDYGLDFLEAPEIGSYVSLYFEHNDWELSASRFTSDFRPPKKGMVWDFQLTSNKTDHPVQLSFRPLKQLPGSLQIRLVDKEAAMDVDLMTDSTYTFQFSRKEIIRNFKIVAGDAEFMQKQADTLENLPIQAEPVRNFPNPFNHSTVISYELNMGTIVDLAIYNLLAQKVRQLRSGYQEKGFYQMSWDARDDTGGALGTGVYIIRLETPEFTHTCKMVYMR